MWKAEGRPCDKGYASYNKYKKSKKAFTKELRRLTGQYENDEVLETINAAEVNKKFFFGS